MKRTTTARRTASKSTRTLHKPAKTRNATAVIRQTGNAWAQHWNAGRLDDLVAAYAPDAVWDMNPLGGLGTFEGHPAIRRFLEDWHSNYEELEIALEEILDLGNGVGFVVTRLTGRPVGSPGSTLTRRRPLAFMWV